MAKAYYAKLLDAAENERHDKVPVVVRDYGIESGTVWQQVRDSMPKDIVD